MQWIKNCNDYKLGMNSIKNLSGYLLDYHIKPSVQRLAILEYLIANRIHPTAEDVYKALYLKMPTLSRTTVYNTLKLFASQGALQLLAIDEKNVRFDIDTSVHAHFKCQHCLGVFDIPVEHIDSIKIADNAAWQVTEMHVYYKGYCKNCLQRPKDNNKINN